MITLFASIACSVAVSALLKLARRYALHIGQAIAANYAVAAALTLLLLNPRPSDLLADHGSWPVLLGLGFLLPSVFLVMAASVQRAGIVLSDAAQRLSLVVSLTAAFVLMGERPTPAGMSGIAVGLAALACLLARPREGSSLSSRHAWLLLLVWAGYGTIDILFKQLSRSGAAFASGLLVCFVLAGMLMLAGLLATRTPWQARSLAAGLVLGLLNFGNIYFYIRAHQAFADSPTLVFTVMNIGVIAAGTLVGVALFKERPSRINLAGVALALSAIAILIRPWTPAG